MLAKPRLPTWMTAATTTTIRPISYPFQLFELPNQAEPSSHPRPLHKRHFHLSPSRRDDSPNRPGLPNHYEALGVAPDASQQEIKKKFYHLSKTHHPDLHPSDPQGASARFIPISTAYAVLSSPDSRAKYDRDYSRAYGPARPPDTASSSPYPAGSHSSSSTTPTPAGGRAASGLSRRRTQFRGPPPSFYRSGGWGKFGEKRAQAAEAGRNANAQQGEGDAGSFAERGRVAGSDGADASAGTGPGGFASGFDDDVPHFDRQGHLRTHSEIARTRHRARRRVVRTPEEIEAEMSGAGGGGSSAFNFFAVTGVLGLVVGSTVLVGGWLGAVDSRKPNAGKKRTREEG